MPSKGTVSEPVDKVLKPTEADKRWTAESVRQLRTGAKLTQENFALALGVSRSTVLDWEKGKEISPLSIGALDRFASGVERATPPSAVREAAPPTYGASEYWAGVNDAALMMSRTVTQLLEAMAAARAGRTTRLASLEELDAATTRQREIDAATPREGGRKAE